MHSISLVVIGVLLTIANTYGTTTEPNEIEEPKILSLTDAKISSNADETKTPYKREVWQEDDHEVLIRNERGTKDNGSGATTGKKQNKKDKNPNNTKNAQKQNLNKPSDTNSDTPNTTTQETVKKHHQKHEKNINSNNNNNNKKHATTTEKLKHKEESKNIPKNNYFH